MAVLAAVTSLVLAPFLGASTAGASTSSKPPVLTEPFTPLPCNQNTTVGEEGCAESKLLRADGLIDRQLRLLFSLTGATQHEYFVTEEKAWLNYRRATCASLANVYRGGSEAPVLYASCEVGQDHVFSSTLRVFFIQFEQGQSSRPRWP